MVYTRFTKPNAFYSLLTEWRGNACGTWNHVCVLDAGFTTLCLAVAKQRNASKYWRNKTKNNARVTPFSMTIESQGCQGTCVRCKIRFTALRRLLWLRKHGYPTKLSPTKPVDWTIVCFHGFRRPRHGLRQFQSHCYCSSIIVFIRMFTGSSKVYKYCSIVWNTFGSWTK